MRAAVVCLLAAARIISGVCDPGTNADTRRHPMSAVRCVLAIPGLRSQTSGPFLTFRRSSSIVAAVLTSTTRGGITRRIIVSLAATSGRARSTRRIPVGVDTTQMTIRTGQTPAVRSLSQRQGFLEATRLLRGAQRELSRIDRHSDHSGYIRVHAEIYRHRLSLRLLLTRPAE